MSMDHHKISHSRELADHKVLALLNDAEGFGSCEIVMNVVEVACLMNHFTLSFSVPEGWIQQRT